MFYPILISILNAIITFDIMSLIGGTSYPRSIGQRMQTSLFGEYLTEFMVELPPNLCIAFYLCYCNVGLWFLLYELSNGIMVLQ